MGYWERLDEEMPDGGPEPICWSTVGLPPVMGAGMIVAVIVDTIRLVARLF